MEKIQNYSKELDYTYTLGAFPTIELMESRPDLLRAVFIHSKFDAAEALQNRCDILGIRYEFDDKTIHRISNKDNVYVAGIFEKFPQGVEDENHIVLVEPSDMGNMGTILRTMVGFGYRDLILIGNACDLFHPKTVRSSMGAIVKIRYRCYESLESYLEDFPERNYYPFLLDEGATPLKDVKAPEKYSLIFGNEGSGLPEIYKEIGESVYIPQTQEVDSLNLTIAAGIGMYHFMK